MAKRCELSKPANVNAKQYQINSIIFLTATLALQVTTIHLHLIRGHLAPLLENRHLIYPLQIPELLDFILDRVMY